MSNEIITLVKDTALARVLGSFIDIIRRSELFATSANPLLWPLFYSAVFFLIFVGGLTLLFNYLEKKLKVIKENPEVKFIFNDVNLFGSEKRIKIYDR